MVRIQPVNMNISDVFASLLYQMQWCRMIFLEGMGSELQQQPSIARSSCYLLPHASHQVIKGWRGTFLLMGLITRLGRQNGENQQTQGMPIAPRVGIRCPLFQDRPRFGCSDVVHHFHPRFLAFLGYCHGMSKGWFDWQVGAKLDSLHGEDGSSVRAFGWPQQNDTTKTTATWAHVWQVSSQNQFCFPECQA